MTMRHHDRKIRTLPHSELSPFSPSSAESNNIDNLLCSCYYIITGKISNFKVIEKVSTLLKMFMENVKCNES